MIHDFHNHNPSVVNYAMFVAVFGMLSLLYLIAATFNEAFAINSLFVVIADALNTIFFLIGGIALAARLGVHSCGNRVPPLGFHSSPPRRVALTRWGRTTDLRTQLLAVHQNGVMKRKP